MKGTAEAQLLKVKGVVFLFFVFFILKRSVIE